MEKLSVCGVDSLAEHSQKAGFYEYHNESPGSINVNFLTSYQVKSLQLDVTGTPRLG